MTLVTVTRTLNQMHTWPESRQKLRKETMITKILRMNLLMKILTLTRLKLMFQKNPSLVLTQLTVMKDPMHLVIAKLKKRRKRRRRNLNLRKQLYVPLTFSFFLYITSQKKIIFFFFTSLRNQESLVRKRRKRMPTNQRGLPLLS